MLSFDGGQNVCRDGEASLTLKYCTIDYRRSSMELRVIQGIPLCKRYLKAFYNVLKKPDSLKQSDHTSLKQAVLYGVKYINTHKYEHKDYATEEEVENKLFVIQIVKELMMQLTPKEFVNLFPIKKEYNHGNEEICWKDYFYTANKLKEYDMNSPLGDKFEDLIWDYTNDTICKFIVVTLCTASKFKQFQGQPSIAEEWAEKNDISTYTVNETQGYIVNNQTHRSAPMKKKAPNYLKLVN